MNAPLVSIILPNFNGAPYLEQALNALVQQPFSTYELIIVDDASTDRSVAIFEDYAKKYASIRILRNETNQGVVITQQRGIAESRGEFIHLTASDDMIEKDLYTDSVRLLQKYPAAGLCSSASRFMNEQGHEIDAAQAKPIVCEEGYWPPAKSLQYLRTYGSWFWGNTVIYRRSAYDAAQGFRKEFGSYSDNILCQELALKKGVCYVPRPLGWWRRSTSQYSSQTMAKPDLYLGYVESIAAWMAAQPDHLFPQDYILLWRRRQIFELARKMMATHAGIEQEVADLIDSHLIPKTRRDQWAIALIRHTPFLSRPVLKLLKSQRMLPSL